ncbi:MAG TPA: phosphodiester glycosidase family protein, partial [Niabella sp.]|nr:phosphodiester glycosidase family protein [Niabella sp.]
HVKLVNTSGSPLSLYFFTVDLSNPDISMEVATPNEQPAFALQTVRTQAIRKNTALENRGEQKHVIGAVNGDYWDVSGNPGIVPGTPLGPVIKNKTVVKNYFIPTGAYYFLSIQTNKRAVIGDRNLFAKLSNMKETLGGRYLLVYNGEDRTASLNTNVEPRTAVGLVNMNKVIFMVLDGRRPEHSVGITMAGLAKIFMAIGAKDAINLDGGGSSTFVSYNKATNDLEIKNMPSDNSPRNVANSWTIISEK